jgi:hypothetical protein
MKGFTSPLWPIRYKPLPDELLSSWLVRLAHGHGLKVQTFCNLIFGNRHQVWNRDIDRLGPDWLVKELSARTGTPLQIAYGTTLRAYEGLLYPQFKLSGVLQWILTLQMYHRKREGFGLQYCPLCLREDSEPYFRRSWRVAFNTICVKHHCMLRDRCPNCGAGVAFHRRDMGSMDAAAGSLAECQRCGFDLRVAETEPGIRYDESTSDWLATLCCQLTHGDTNRSVLDLDSLDVMRQLAMLMTSRYRTVKLHAHVCEQLGVPEMEIDKGRIAFETRPITERHHLAQTVAWLMMDLRQRLLIAWRAKAIRYNHLGKDFENAPVWYLNVVEGFANWRCI